ncbi:MAG TPA: hypothetical protein VK796_06005, partial [Cytophaga sp.]|nr:hypothetical protein [Cytophaga sp.]
PPYNISVCDTGAYILPELKNEPLTALTFEAVEDTILPPCDIVFFKSGKLEYCKIIETTPTTITYKMCNYQDGPNIVINKSDIHKIRYANGEEEIIAVDKPTVNAYAKPKKDVLARLSLIFGITSIGLVLLFGGAIPAVALAGIVLGIISFIKISRRKGELRGKGSAILGVLLCVLALLLIL